jgi:long-chain acyl-CoA synthetase
MELGYTTVNAYGLTETSAAATVTPVRDNKIGTVGKPLRGTSIRINSPDDQGVGEVCVRGPLLMKGYYLDDAHTAEMIQDGWLHTGDLGFIDSDNNLTITGRSKDVIVLANGKNIYPEEIETHYAQSPYIKELCVLGVTESADAPEGEKLHAIVVPDMDEFRARGQSAITDLIRFDMESLSRELPSYQRVLSFSIRNEPLPRTVTRKLKRFEIQDEVRAREEARKSGAVDQDHPRFQTGVGRILASLIHKAKPEAGGLQPSQTLELDLGFDSLARVELLAEIESKTGAHIDDEEASRIYTLDELVAAVEKNSGNPAAAGRGWKEFLAVPESDELNRHYIFRPKPVATNTTILLSRILRLLSLGLFRLRWSGIENIPRNGPFLMCPNHESFLDAPMLYAVLPSYVIANTFSLGYSDYWQGRISSRIAEWTNIVSIDPDVNLTRAMQAGAVGLKRNKILLVFPEGTRSIDGRVAEFKKGAAILACELGVPVVPVGINGTHESWPRKGGFRFRPIEINFGKPIDPRQFSNLQDPYTVLTEQLRNEVKALTHDV